MVGAGLSLPFSELLMSLGEEEEAVSCRGGYIGGLR